MLTDAHAHLNPQKPLVVPPQINAVWLNSATPDDWDAIVNCQRQFPNRFHAFIGIHPFCVSTDDVANATLVQSLKQRLDTHGAFVTGIGEIGLDGSKAFRNTLNQQRAVFLQQLDIACEHGLPVAVHARNAWGAITEILATYAQKGLRGYCHAFSAGPDIAKRLLDCGFKLSFGPLLLNPHAVRARHAVAMTPTHARLAETDAFYISDENNIAANLLAVQNELNSIPFLP